MKILCVEPGPTHSTWDLYQGLSKALREVGHGVGSYSLHNRIPHADKCLRMRWEDAGSPADKEPGANEVIFHASQEIVTIALIHQVDWVLFVSSGLVHPQVYTLLRRAGVKTAMILTECPYEDERQLEIAMMVDVLWVNEITSVPVYGALNPRTLYWCHAYDPEVHHWRPSEEHKHDVVFVGTLWQERIDMLCAVDWHGIDLGIYGSAELFNLEKYPYNEDKFRQLEPYLHVGYVDNERTVDLYSVAKIGWNLHRTSMSLGGSVRVTGAKSMNPRCFEQAAVGGSLLVTDHRLEVQELLPDAQIYRDPGSLKATIDYFLDHPEDRAYHTAKMQHQIGPHMFLARAQEITAELEKGV